MEELPGLIARLEKVAIRLETATKAQTYCDPAQVNKPTVSKPFRNVNIHTALCIRIQNQLGCVFRNFIGIRCTIGEQNSETKQTIKFLPVPFFFLKL